MSLQSHVQQTVVCPSKTKNKQTKKDRDFPGGPEAKTTLPTQGAQVPSLVRELESPHAATKTQCSQIFKVDLKKTPMVTN